MSCSSWNSIPCTANIGMIAPNFNCHGMTPARPISWRRNGNLSMARLISRASQGRGLRSLTCPSLSMTTSEKPRGCNSWRQGLLASGSASVITTTSRSTRASGRLRKASSCSRKAGSSGTSAKTTTGRATQRNCSGSTLDASYSVMATASASGTAGASTSSGLCGCGKGISGATDGTAASRAGPMAARAIANNRKFNFIGTSSLYEYRTSQPLGKDGS